MEYDSPTLSEPFSKVWFKIQSTDISVCNSGVLFKKTLPLSSHYPQLTVGEISFLLVSIIAFL
jgi:hypothetical protein